MPVGEPLQKTTGSFSDQGTMGSTLLQAVMYVCEDAVSKWQSPVVFM
jgi:hypothetical protein